nr:MULTISPECIES: GNAT family N-acetyltransferase [unclassified Mesorhizobium]
MMWVEETCRGVGHGRKLLDAFVSEAAARGARRVWVSTHDFQAPGLYEKAGFERMAESAGWPEGLSNIILCKTMVPR